MENLYLEVSNVATSYKNFSMKNVNFSLKSGQIMGLIGHSGSGKSTLVKTLVGLKKLDKGQINFYIDNIPAVLNNYLGYSPQENSLFPYLTLKENIIAFGKLKGLSKSYINERMNLLLKKLKLDYAQNKKIVELSGGMAKRADLIITLLDDPKVIILDEPFAGLDFSLIKFIWNTIGSLAGEGKIIIVSSHLLPDIQKHCTTLGFVYGGNLYDTKQLIYIMKQKKLFSLEDLFERI